MFTKTILQPHGTFARHQQRLGAGAKLVVDVAYKKHAARLARHVYQVTLFESAFYFVWLP